MTATRRLFAKDGKRVEMWAVDFRFKHPNGSSERIQLRSPVNTKRGAEQFERDVREQLQAGTFRKGDQEPAKAMTFAELKEAFIVFSNNNNKPSSLHSKEYILRLHLMPFFGAMPLDEIGAEDIERYKSLKQEESEGESEGTVAQSPKSINNHLAVLRKALNLAVEYGFLAKAPKVKGLRIGAQDFDFLTFDETPRFLAAAKPEWRPMFHLALATGLRIGELLALKWEDIDLTAGKIIVKRTLWHGNEGTPKGGKRREVPISTKTAEMLKANKHEKGPYVFCRADGSHHTHNQLQDLVPKTCSAAGLPKRLTWHDLRHTFASHLVMRGRSIVEVQQLLGHTTLAMTLRYAHLSPDVKRNAVEALDSSFA